MSEFKSYAQSGQDRFAFEVLDRKTDGTFLDVGAGHVTEKSNSYGLEQIGWRGLCVDLNPQGDITVRQSPFVALNAIYVDWEAILSSLKLWPEIDYLSLDVDRATVDVLIRLPLDRLRFKAITVEHDLYLVGGAPRAAMRNILTKAGYYLMCADVCDQGMAYEDWWVDTSLSEKAELFRYVGKDWKDIFK